MVMAQQMQDAMDCQKGDFPLWSPPLFCSLPCRLGIREHYLAELLLLRQRWERFGTRSSTPWRAERTPKLKGQDVGHLVGPPETAVEVTKGLVFTAPPSSKQ